MLDPHELTMETADSTINFEAAYTEEAKVPYLFSPGEALQKLNEQDIASWFFHPPVDFGESKIAMLWMSIGQEARRTEWLRWYYPNLFDNRKPTWLVLYGKVKHWFKHMAGYRIVHKSVLDYYF